MEAAAVAAGGGAARRAERPLAQVAEELVRTSGGTSLAWESVRVSSRFQPVFSTRRGTCAGFEALMDARDALGAGIAPEELFARTAFASRTLLDWACRALHFRNYATVDPGDRILFVNIHPESAIRDARRARDFGELIGYYGLVPSRVCVEILETPCSDEVLLAEAVAGYRELGASIAMDDFGVGCSGFARVLALRPDIVKVDRSLLARSVGSDEARRSLPHMVEVLHETGARVAIEGIESEAEARHAIAANADYLQGHYFCPPRAMALEERDGAATLDRLLGKRRVA